METTTQEVETITLVPVTTDEIGSTNPSASHITESTKVWTTSHSTPKIETTAGTTVLTTEENVNMLSAPADVMSSSTETLTLYARDLVLSTNDKVNQTLGTDILLGTTTMIYQTKDVKEGT